MLKSLQRRIKDLERKLNTPRPYDLEDPRERRRATLHSHLMDHAFLRVLWTNFYKVADGVYRSNQPSPARLRRYADFGIKTVLNLRGSKP
ncbi:protein tyrosine phosphatase, partial [Thioclava sp. BHET1]